MSSFWIRVSLASILGVCSRSFGQFTGHGQYGLHHHKYHGHNYQTDFDQVVQASHDTHQAVIGYHDGHGYEDYPSYGYYPPHYAYGYSVHGYDPYGGPGPRYDKSETRDGATTEGGYSVDLPDGRTQIVTYTVRGEEGFVANVSYVPTETLH